MVEYNLFGLSIYLFVSETTSSRLYTIMCMVTLVQ